METINGMKTGLTFRDLCDPEPDPAKRRYILRVPIMGPGDYIKAKPYKQPRLCKTRLEVQELLGQGVTDPWDIAARLNLGVSAIRRHLGAIWRDREGQ